VKGKRGRHMRRREFRKGRPPCVAGASRQVYLVDRHALMRRAAAEWINRCEALTVCGMAGRVARALREINRMHPDAVVTEILRPHDLGFVKELHRQHPRLPILVFTIQEAASHREWAVAAGASAYLMKKAGGDKLVRALQTMLERTSDKVVRGSAGKRRSPGKSNAPEAGREGLP
jgi:DNA-binding NarL/FixJ family response regulator